MTEPEQPPDWAVDLPSAKGVRSNNKNDLQRQRPFTIQQLLEFGAEFIEQFLRRVVEAVLGFFPGGASAFDLLSDWGAGVNQGVAQAVNFFADILTAFGLGSVANWITDLLGTRSNAGTALTNANNALGQIGQLLTAAGQATATALGNAVKGTVNSFADILSGFGLSSIANWITDLLGTRSTAGTAATNATTALGQFQTFLTNAGAGTAATVGAWLSTARSQAQTAVNNFADVLTGFGLGSVGSWITDLLGTKSTAGTAGTNATTALGNWTTFLSNAAEGTVATVGAALATAKANAQASVNNFASILTGFGLGTVGNWITDLLGTRSTATTAGANATTALGSASTANSKIQFTSAANMVIDASFETAMWIDFTGVAASTAQAHTGTQSRRLTGPSRFLYFTNLGMSGVGNQLPCSPGDYFYVEAWLYRDSANGSTGNLFALGARFFNTAAGTNTNAGSLTVAQSAVPAGVWTKYSVLMQVPAGHDRTVPYIQTGSGVGAGDLLYVDDVIVREATIAVGADTKATTALDNLGAIFTSAAEATYAAIGTALAQAKANANTAIGNFTSILSGMGLGTIANLISDLTGTRSTAGTAGTNATNALGQLTALISNAGQSLAGGVGTMLANAAENTRLTLLNLWQGLTGSGSTADRTPAEVKTASAAVKSTADTASTNASTAGGNLQTVVDNIFQGVGGVGTSNPVSTVLDSIANLFGISTDAGAAAADAAAQIAALQAANNGGANNGKFVTYDFAPLPDGAVPAAFTKILDSGSGGVVISNGRLAWSKSGGGSPVELYVYNIESLASDYFEVSAVMPSGPEVDPFTGANGGFKWLGGRINASGTQGVWAQFGKSTVRFYYINGGALTSATLPIDASVPGGSILKFRGGGAGGARVFQCLVGNAVKGTWTDGGAVTAMGPANRLCGDGLQPGARFDGTQNSPGTISFWTMSDNTPAAIVGQGLQVYRNSTSGLAVGAGGAGALFDTIEAQTSDFLGWNAATSTFTASAAGWYTIDIGARSSNGLVRGERSGLCILIDGVIKRRGQMIRNNNGTSSNPSGSAWDIAASLDWKLTTVVYLNAGQTVRPAFDYDSRTIVGNAAGDCTNMTITRRAA